MSTTQSQNWLQALESQLQQLLQQQLPHGSVLQVRCGLKQGELVVVTQHPSVVSPDALAIFNILEQGIRAVQREIGSQARSCRLGIRSAGQTMPYETHAVSWSVAEGREGLELSPEITGQMTAEAGTIAPLSPDRPQSDSPEEHLSSIALLNADDPEAGLLPLPAESPAPPPLLPSLLSFFSQPTAVVGTALGLVILGTGIYALTRPCVVGECVPLQKAQQHNQAALQRIQQPQSAQEVVESYQQLVESNYLLSTIPSWSAHYEAAQGLIQSYEAEAQILEKVVNAQKRAYEAAVQSQNPPHPLPTWRQVQQNWQAAIAQLDQVPPDSPIYALAQSKRAEYQGNLTTINQYIIAEQQDQERVRIARQTAAVADTRTGVANSLGAWKQVQDTWQAVINLLRQVSRNTMAFGEAQQLLALYEPKLKMAGDRLRQEQAATQTYEQAVSLASQAQQSERENQWTQAVVYWRNALTRVQQVPNGTSRFTQAQPLVASYRAALGSAQQKLRVAIGWQTAQVGLQKTCAGIPILCTYASAGDSIQVRLTAGFTQAVQQSLAGSPTSTTASNTTVLSYMNPLLQDLAVVGERADLPIELYNPDGSLFGTYEPKLDGYVPVRARDIARGELGR